MSFTIESGGRTRSKAVVTESGKLLTYSTIISEENDAAEEGFFYNLVCPVVTLTGDAETPIHYVKNSGEALPFIVKQIIISTTASDVLGEYFVGLARNPQSGTIITSPKNMDVVNYNIGSGNKPLIDAYYGVYGDTVLEDTEPRVQSMVSGTGGPPVIINTHAVFPRGSSGAVTITPPVGNTSMKVQITVNAFLKSGRSF